MSTPNDKIPTQAAPPDESGANSDSEKSSSEAGSSPNSESAHKEKEPEAAVSDDAGEDSETSAAEGLGIDTDNDEPNEPVSPESEGPQEAAELNTGIETRKEKDTTPPNRPKWSTLEKALGFVALVLFGGGLYFAWDWWSLRANRLKLHHKLDCDADKSCRNKAQALRSFYKGLMKYCAEKDENTKSINKCANEKTIVRHLEVYRRICANWKTPTECWEAVRVQLSKKAALNVVYLLRSVLGDAGVTLANLHDYAKSERLEEAADKIAQMRVKFRHLKTRLADTQQNLEKVGHIATKLRSDLNKLRRSVYCLKENVRAMHAKKRLKQVFDSIISDLRELTSSALPASRCNWKLLLSVSTKMKYSLNTKWLRQPKYYHHSYFQTLKSLLVKVATVCATDPNSNKLRKQAAAIDAIIKANKKQGGFRCRVTSVSFRKKANYSGLVAIVYFKADSCLRRGGGWEPKKISRYGDKFQLGPLGKLTVGCGRLATYPPCLPGRHYIRCKKLSLKIRVVDIASDEWHKAVFRKFSLSGGWVKQGRFESRWTGKRIDIRVAQK